MESSVKSSILRKFLLSSLIVFPLSLASCSLFEVDVSDFMEKYTETAAVEDHEISVSTYNDSLDQICIASEEDTIVSLYMRNPKKYNLVPSVVFKELDATLSRDSVSISQIDSNTLELSLPQEFLIPADGGKDITAEISLYEPMSGRDFDKYKLPLHCNTIPPQILNPTILSNNGQSFVLAFEMPNEEEVAVRHLDLCAVEINGVSYPVEITTEEDAEGIKHAVYNFTNPLFTRTASPDYIPIGGKTFSENRNSVYFETNEPIIAIEKVYTLVLKDEAGLSSTVSASTTISKLQKPVIKNQQGAVILESVNGSFTGIPFDEDTTKGKITIIPPTKDHHDNDLSGVPLVYYKIYEATGSGRIYSSGTTTTELEIELPQNSYRVEAYATLVNYEQSATTTVKFRFINNAIYVKSDAEDNGDGSELWPWKTIAEAFADINGDDRRRESKYILYLDGDFNESVVVDGRLNTDALEIQKYARASSASVNKIQVGGTSDALDSDFVLDIGEITISSGNGIVINQGIKVTVEGANIRGSHDSGIKIDGGANLTFKSGEIFQNQVGVSIADGTFNYEGGTISASGTTGISVSNGSLCNVRGGTITSANSAAGSGITIASGATCNISNATIINNEGSGVIVNNGATLNISGKVLINNNTKPASNTNDPPITANVVLNGSAKINVTDELDADTIIGVTTPSLPTGDGVLQFTNGYGTNNTLAPGYIFFSDAAYGVMLSSGEAALSQSHGGISSQYDYTVEFKPAPGTGKDGNDEVFDTKIEVGVNKTISVVPVIKKNGNPVTFTEDELKWQLYITCHQDIVQTSNTNTIALDGRYIMDDIYYVHINMIYKGILFDREIKLVSHNEKVVFDSYSIVDLKNLIEKLTDDTTIVMKTGVTVSSTSGTTIDIPSGITVTLERDPANKGALLSAGSWPRELRINSTNPSERGTLVLDGGASSGIVANSPLFVDNCGSGNIHNVVFQNNNNANGSGGAVSGGISTCTKFYNCEFKNCSASNGGAGYFRSNVWFLDCTFENCRASNRGGGLYLTGANANRDDWIKTDDQTLNNNEIKELFTSCSAGSGSGSGNRIYFYKSSYKVGLNGTWYSSNDYMD